MEPGRRRLKPEERRELILASALRAFDERGYHAASISEIARGAGTTKAVVYDHFESKRALYDALVRQELEGIIEATASVRVPEGGWEVQLRAILDVWFGYVRERPHTRRLLFETIDADPEVGARHRRSQGIATRAIAERLAQVPGLLEDVSDRELELEMVAQMFKSTLNGLADWWFDHPEIPQERVVDRASGFLLGALRDAAE